MQRTTYANAALSEERVRRLNAVTGWTWDPRGDKWEEGYVRLQAFVAREHHARVQHGHVEDGYPLGNWVSAQRVRYSQAGLAESRVRRLETVPGWTW